MGIKSALFDIRHTDLLVLQDTCIHKLDPRAKVVVTSAFILTVVSYDKYTISGLIPLVLYPILLLAVSGLPIRILFKAWLPALPFAVGLGIFNPIFDREIIVNLGLISISGGWISFASILLKLMLTLSAAVILIATTRFDALCFALNRFGIPKAITTQLVLLYRYVFVLVDQASRMVNAWSLRSFGKRKLSINVFSSLIGHLLVRSLDRAHRIYWAMVSRGFNGEIRLFRPLAFRWSDFLFVAGWVGFFVSVRLYNIPLWFGQFVMELTQ